jgi:hypothetical protein
MREACDRYRVFMKRLELSDDPAAREYLRAINAQMLEGGFTMGMMFNGWAGGGGRGGGGGARGGPGPGRAQRCRRGQQGTSGSEAAATAPPRPGLTSTPGLRPPPSPPARLEQSLTQYEGIVAQEEAILSDPVRHQVGAAGRRSWREGGAGGRTGLRAACPLRARRRRDAGAPATSPPSPILTHPHPHPPPPTPHPQEFSKQLKEHWSQSAMGRIDMNYLAR